MKAYFTVSCLLTISTIFANPAKQAEVYLIEDETVSLFQRYLTNCRKHNMANQPVYLRNACREKNPSSNDVFILNLDPPSTMQINDIVERILYGDADVVHLRNISTNTASHLYELLQKNYTHFIHVPCQEKGLFVASKYLLKQAEVTRIEQENASYKDVLKFAIHEDNICARVGISDLSIQVVNSSGSDDNTTTPILLVDVPGTLTVVKQQREQFFQLQLEERIDLLATETFEIIPVRRGGGDNDDSGGAYGGGRVDVEFGPGGPEWSASAFGGYEDDQGNYVEVEVRRNEDGKTSASVEGGHDKDK
jgi:hypothetical protein